MPATPKPHDFTCQLRWTGAASGPTTTYRAYSRTLSIDVPGKAPLPASAAPPFLGDGTLHNPEDLLVGALTACHCLSYLALAARIHLEVVGYGDDASGTMEWDGTSYRFTRVVLRPTVTVKRGSDLARARALHEEAHSACFIARSVGFPVSHEATMIEAE